MENVIEVRNLKKQFKNHLAVNQVSFEVARGEIFGMVGPNGAGKTTTMNLLMGLLKPDEGSIAVLGLNPVQEGKSLRRRLGIQLQQAELPEHLRVGEALDLFASFYATNVDPERLMSDWGLTSKKRTYFGHLSGGERQRLFIALALINDPEIVCLDEITTGLDPMARRQTWDLVRAIRKRGKTVLMVTHFMEEAERLCDRVAIFNQGKLIALDHPQDLVARHPSHHVIRFNRTDGLDLKSIETIPEAHQVECLDDEIVITGEGSILLRVAANLAEQNIDPAGFRCERATLEDVFLHLTHSDSQQ